MRLRRPHLPASVEARLGGWARYWRAKGVIPRWQLVLVYVLIAAATAIGFAQVNKAIDQVQASRVRTCDDNAQKNRDTVKELDAQIRKTTDPVRRARAIRNRDATIALINTLAPPRTHEECVALVHAEQ